MKKFLILLCLVASQGSRVFAQGEQKIDIPIGRQGFHDNIDKEQAAAAKFDGKADDFVKVSDDKTINLQVTNAIIKQVDDMQMDIERDTLLDHRLKIKYLSGLYVMLHDYNSKRAYRNIDPAEAPAMVAAYRDMMKADIHGQSILPIVRGLSFNAGEKVIEVFKDNPSYKEARGVMFGKYAYDNLETVMTRIGSYLEYPETDSIIAAVARKYPNQVLTYATSYTPVAAAIKKNQDPVVQLIVKIGSSGQSTRILPFIDELIDGTMSVDSLEKVVGGDYSYFKQMVKKSIVLQQSEE